jgi:hypothetical protein
MEQPTNLTTISNIAGINFFSGPNCKRNERAGNYIIYSLVHITGLFIIISSVYLFYTKKMTENLVNDELNHLATDAITEKLYSLDPATQSFIKNKLKIVELEQVKKLYIKPDAEYTKNNAWVIHGIYATIIVLIIIILIANILSKQYCSNIHFKDILKENLVIFLFIGIIEFMFFKYAILKYIPYGPSYVNNLVISHIKQL